MTKPKGIVQGSRGFFAIRRSIGQSVEISLKASVPPSLPLREVFSSPIRIKIERVEDGTTTVVISTQSMLDIRRAEDRSEEEVPTDSTDILNRPELSLEEHRLLLSEYLRLTDMKRGELREKIFAEGEAAKKERRAANKQKIDAWKRNNNELAEKYLSIKHKLGEIKAQIKQRNVMTQGRGRAENAQILVEQAFFTAARLLLTEDDFARVLAEAKTQATHSKKQVP